MVSYRSLPPRKITYLSSPVAAKVEALQDQFEEEKLISQMTERGNQTLREET